MPECHGTVIAAAERAQRAYLFLSRYFLEFAAPVRRYDTRPSGPVAPVARRVRCKLNSREFKLLFLLTLIEVTQPKNCFVTTVRKLE